MKQSQPRGILMLQINLLEDNDDTKTLSTDMTMSMLGVFVILLVGLIFWLNPVGEAQKKDIEPPGRIIVEIRWPDGLDIDIDTWGLAPGEPSPVGYSNMNGIVLNLLRDDLGNHADASRKNGRILSPENSGRAHTLESLNHENMFTRGATSGHYRFTVHLFADRDKTLQCIPVDFQVSMRNPTGEGKSQLIIIESNTVELCKVGEEVSLINFEIDQDGNLVPDSKNYIYEPLRQINTDD